MRHLPALRRARGARGVDGAVLYDVHGNLAALDAVLADAEAEAFDRLVVGGDLALFGPEAPGCVDRLRLSRARSH